MPKSPANLTWLSLGALLVSCTQSPPSGVAPGQSDSARPNYAMRQAYTDSLEQAQLTRFFSEYQSRVRPMQEAANYLGEMALLRELAGKYPLSAGVRSLTTQQIATYSSFFGEYQEALRLFDQVDDDPPSGDTLNLDRLPAVSAVTAILAMADSHRVIFINEAHHVPQHRALTLALLEGLRARGFTYLAAETLSEQDSALNTREYPVHSSGYYSNEPLFGEVLRRARELGYTLVPYESVGESSQEGRETGQATNLRDRIFAAHPDARVLVHAGYSHINESGLIAGAKPMAVHFRELTGIDPLTVDQTTMREHGSPVHELPGYRATVARAGLEAPFILQKPDGQPWSFRPAVHDVTVFSPPSRFRDGRPEWLWRAGERHPYPIPAEVCPRGRECAVTAQRRGESADAVPLDAVLVHPGTTPPTMLLPPGTYLVKSRDSTGTVLSEREVSIRPGGE